MNRLSACLAGAAVALAATFAPLPAAAAPASCEGVWVVVDATALGGQVTTACATSHSTGIEALTGAGFTVARSSGMICRIDELPERCEVAATAYWSYWQAVPSGDGYDAWVYANLGPDSYHPRGGDAEGWVFGDGSVSPSSVPDQLATPGTHSGTPAAPAASPTPAATPTPASGEPGSASGPVTLALVAGVIAVATIGLWLARRRQR